MKIPVLTEAHADRRGPFLVAQSAIRWLENLQSGRRHGVLLRHAEQSPDADMLIEVGPLDDQPLGLNLEVVSLGLRPATR